MKTALYCVVVVGLCSCASAQSQPPTPTTGPQRQEQQDHRSQQQDSQPPFKPTPPPSGQAIPERDKAEGSADRTKENQAPIKQDAIGLTAILQTFAAVISAGFTAAVFYVYRGQLRTMKHQSTVMRKSLAVTKRAADAATESAEIAKSTLHVSQRAYLNVLGVSFENLGPGQFPYLVVEVKNSGFLPATITAHCSALHVAIAPPNPRKDPTDWLLISSVVAPGQTVRLENRPEDGANGLGTEQWEALQLGNFKLAVSGALRYEAGFGIEGEVGYGAIFIPTVAVHLPFNKRFSSLDFAGYNYSR